MKDAIGKSFARSITFSLAVIGVFIGLKINISSITVLIVSFLLSYSILFTWLIYEPVKEGDILKNENKALIEKIHNVENTNKDLMGELGELKENNEGLIQERISYQRIIDKKDGQILILEESNKSLRARIIGAERGCKNEF